MTGTATTDEQLEQAFQSSPEEGLARLHQDYQALLGRYLKSLTGGLLGAEELRDVYQETLIEVLKAARRPGFDPERPLRLVYRVARLRAYRFLRRRRSARPWDEAAEEASCQAAAALLERAEGQELRATLEAAIEELPPRQRLIARITVENIVGLHAAGRYAAIAEEAGRRCGEELSPRAVKSAWNAARAKLVSVLERQGFYREGGR